MRSSTSTFALLAAALPSLVNGHGYVTKITYGSKSVDTWAPFVDPYAEPVPSKPTWKINSDGPVSDVSSDAIVCGEGATAPVATVMKGVKAGDKVTMQWTTWPSDHRGPVMTYMASCDGDCTKFQATNGKWFKIDAKGLENGKWASDTLIDQGSSWTFTIPSSLKAGEYLLRHEILALHSAENPSGAQFYPSCNQLSLTSSGSLEPKGVALPGAYSATDPGILVNIWADNFNSYTIPGPAVISGASSGGSSSGSDDSEDSDDSNSGSTGGSSGGSTGGSKPSSAAASSATPKPAAEKPAAEKPAAEKPAAEKPAAEKPAAEKPAAEKPAAEKPAAEKPATDKPATQANTPSDDTEDSDDSTTETQKPSGDSGAWLGEDAYPGDDGAWHGEDAYPGDDGAWHGEDAYPGDSGAYSGEGSNGQPPLATSQPALVTSQPALVTSQPALVTKIPGVARNVDSASPSASASASSSGEQTEDSTSGAGMMKGNLVLALFLAGFVGLWA